MPRKTTEKTDAKENQKGAGAKQPKKRTETEEDLLDIIEELKNELRARDQEYELMRLRVDKLELSNTSLAKSLLDEKKSKQTIEAKLNKLRHMKELDDNFVKIANGTFFDGKKPNVHSLRTNLLDSVNEQYKSSLSTSYAAKYAHIWLDKVRERRQQRESNTLFNI